MQFKEIDLKKNRNTVVKFRRDSFEVSFRDVSGFDEEEYLRWLGEKVKKFPKGFVLVLEDGKIIGQLELTIRKFEGREIGYINLYYLIPEMRGKGKGGGLHNYAKKFFKDYDVSEYHLRVSPSNTRAIHFYRKNGMEEVGPEADGKVIRMKGYLAASSLEIRYKDIILRDMVEQDIEDDIRWNTIERERELWDEPWEQDEPFNREQFRENELKALKKLEQLKRTTSFRWSLEIDYQDGTHIGAVDTYLIDSNYNRIVQKEMEEGQSFFYALGIAIYEPSYWSKGLGTQALTAYIHHHLEHKNEELYLQTWSGNNRMIHSAKKLGFFICDIQKNIRQVRGHHYDALTLKLNIDQFLASNKK